MATFPDSPSQDPYLHIEDLQSENDRLKKENQRLADDVQQLVKTEQTLYKYQSQLDQQVNTYRQLYELSKALTDSHNLAELYEHVLQFVLYELNFERCLIFLLDTEQTNFQLQAFDGYYDAEVSSQLNVLSFNVTHPHIAPLLSGEDHQVYPAGTEPTALHDILRLDEFVLFPLRRNEQQPIGLIIVGNTAEAWDCYTRITDEPDGLLGLANLSRQVAITIDNIQAYQAIENQKSILEKRVAERTATLNQQNQTLGQTLKQLQTTQAQLVHSEKMSSLGQMVAGVAHEINNPVSFIYGNIQHAEGYSATLLELIEAYQAEFPQTSQALQELTKEADLEFLSRDLPKLFNSMNVGAQRIKEIVLSLRNFSRMDEAELKRVNLIDGLDSTITLIQHRLTNTSKRNAIQLIKDYYALPKIECYANQINQVFLSIISNAIDAIYDSTNATAGKINIKTQVDSTSIKISISDNGTGIDSKTQEKIFDPFFTTKAVGSVTGMGLAISHQIITQHNGHITCTSAPGQGSTFSITLPIN